MAARRTSLRAVAVAAALTAAAVPARAGDDGVPESIQSIDNTVQGMLDKLRAVAAHARDAVTALDIPDHAPRGEWMKTRREEAAGNLEDATAARDADSR